MTHFIFVDTTDLCSKGGCKGTELMVTLRATTLPLLSVWTPTPPHYSLLRGDMCCSSCLYCHELASTLSSLIWFFFSCKSLFYKTKRPMKKTFLLPKNLSLPQFKGPPLLLHIASHHADLLTQSESGSSYASHLLNHPQTFRCSLYLPSSKTQLKLCRWGSPLISISCKPSFVLSTGFGGNMRVSAFKVYCWCCVFWCLVWLMFAIQG